jgi:hypothetical protein
MLLKEFEIPEVMRADRRFGHRCKSRFDVLGDVLGIPLHASNAKTSIRSRGKGFFRAMINRPSRSRHHSIASASFKVLNRESPEQILYLWSHDTPDFS